MNGAAVHTDLRWQRQGRELLQARGTVGMGTAGALDLQIQSTDLNLDLLAPLSPAITNSAGLLTLDLRLTGTLQQPQAHGRLMLQDGVLQLAATGERYKDMQARVVFAGDRVDIEQLQVGSRSGPLQVTGQVALGGGTLQQVKLAIQAQDFTAMHTPSIEAIVSAQVDVQGAGQDLSATGSITVPRARLLFNEIPGSGPQTVKPWELTVDGVYGPGPQAANTTNGTEPSAQSAKAPLPFLRTNLQVIIPRNAWVQGPGTAVELSGEIPLPAPRRSTRCLMSPPPRRCRTTW
jgi:autotransporter translocation and assembly factor TamB